MRRLPEYWRNERGSGAAEFALVLLPFAALIFAIIHLCLAFYANQALQFAAEGAARCSSFSGNTVCTNVANYAKGLYKGPNIGVSFTPSTDVNCGYKVVGTGTYQLNAVFVKVGVPLSATACFP